MRMFRRFARDDRGITMVEFALVGPLFIFLLLAIIELGLTMLTQFVLDGATRSAARLIRTGQLQGQASPITAFQNTVCGQLDALLPTANCGGGGATVLFEVQNFPNGFASINLPACTQNANQAGNGTPCPFQPGTGGQVVAVRVSYPRPYLVPWVGQCLTTGNCYIGLGGGAPTAFAPSYTTDLVSTVVFQNEPF
jgi:Flp pilus assembly protein TadG